MKDLNEIMVFTRVAQLGSFSQAAKSLGMPVSTVSRKVSDLESRMGIMLIQRTTRKLNLTRVGSQFYQQCADLLQGLEAAEAQATELQVHAEGLIKISIPSGIASGGFMDFASDFLFQHPRIHIDFLVSNQFVDLVGEGVDLAIRFGVLADSSLTAKRLGTSSSVLVASPGYLKKHGHPKHPQDLRHHECVVYKSRANGAVWTLTREKSRQNVKVSGRLAASDMGSLRELVLRGHGIALLPDMYCHDALKSGELRGVLPQWQSPISPVHAVYPVRRFLPARVSLFLTALQSWPDPPWSR